MKALILKRLSLQYHRKTFRTIINVDAHFNLELHVIYVKIMPLNSDIDEVIFTQPGNFVYRDPKNMNCRLKKIIYALKQASH